MAEHVCPVWMGYLFVNPLRRLVHNPDKILNGHVAQGMTVLDVGCAMGFFSLPLARRVGPSGRVVCVDMQQGMLDSLEKRARKAGVTKLLDVRTCTPTDLGVKDLADQVDFALAFAMVHEARDLKALLGQLAAALKPGGRLLICEPKGHVSDDVFAAEVQAAEEAGLTVEQRSPVKRGLSVLLSRPQ